MKIQVNYSTLIILSILSIVGIALLYFTPTVIAEETWKRFLSSKFDYFDDEYNSKSILYKRKYLAYCINTYLLKVNPKVYSNQSTTVSVD
jgi:hypothetical protein